MVDVAPPLIRGAIVQLIQDMGFVASAIGFGGAIGQFAMPTVSDFIGRKLATLVSYILAAVFTYLFTQADAESLTTLFWLLFFAALFNFSALAILSITPPTAAFRRLVDRRREMGHYSSHGCSAAAAKWTPAPAPGTVFGAAKPRP